MDPAGRAYRYREWYGCEQKRADVGIMITPRQIAEGILEREKEEMSLLIKADGSYMEVLAKNILYAENEARKIVLHTKNMPESSYTFYEKMEVLEKRLGEGFFRSHRGFLVNLREVYKYDATTIQMKNGDKVYLAKQKYNDFVTAYMKYLRSAG
jgi:DNA-binding LytR/AlgR family response regulator